MGNKKKIKSFANTAEAMLPDGSKCTVFVYGEMYETGLVDGFLLTRARFTRKGHVLREVVDDMNYFIGDENFTHAPVKTFNMGYSICDPRDKFDKEIGIKLAKKRFSKSPLKTQNGNFLTPDMCQAIVDNEANYISQHIENFVK